MERQIGTESQIGADHKSDRHRSMQAIESLHLDVFFHTESCRIYSHIGAPV